MTRKDQTQFLQAKRALEEQITASVDRFHHKVVHSFPKAPVDDHKHQSRGPEKAFRFQESLLTKMFQIQDFRTIYNMAIASFIILTISLFYDDYFNSGEIIDKDTFQSIFGEWQKIPKMWALLTLIHFSIIPLTKLALMAPKKVYIPLYLLHIYVLMFVAMKQASKEESMGFASRLTIMAEGTRMLMKSHSYFRNKLLYLTQNNFKHYIVNSIKAVSSKPHEGGDSNIKEIHIPIENASYSQQIRKLGYFFFAPTLIYRDSYLLSTHRSPSQIIKHFINFLGCVYYALILYKINCKPIINQLESKLDWASLLSTIVNLMLPSVGFLILGFFGFLHSWLNLWAEITRFPDRAFYSDWWNSFQFGSYYRKWNIVVHDWLYYYLYLDICRCFPLIQRNRWVAQLTTFVVSAVIHQVIVDVSLGYFYPILFLLFAGPGVLFVQSTTIKKNSVNLIFWLEMYIGTAMMMTFYLVECFARERVTDEFILGKWGNLSFLIPRTIYL